jgi:hypothetical protein
MDGRVPLHASIRGVSKGGYTTSAGTWQEKVAWDSQTNISEPHRHTNEESVDDSDEEADSDVSTVRQEQH